MAEYINYGDQQIDQQQLLTNLADNVTSYVAAQPWSKKRKQKFMQYYTDMVNRGILGASNDTGQWMLDIGGTPYEEENIPKKDWQMLGEAAYFIQQQMSRMPTKASLEKQEKQETKTPVFDNEYFLNQLGNHISTNEFGGVKFDTQNDWNNLDKRNPETGLRDRTNRAQILARNLQSYADSLTDESKLNFEGSPFKNLADFKERINNAVHALTETPDTLDDDEESLKKLGLRYSDWFNNGSGDPVTVTLDDGTQVNTTYGQLADYNKKLNEQKQQQILAKQKEQEAAKQKQLAAQRANQYDKYQNIFTYNKITNDKLNGLPMPKEYQGKEINYLNELAKNPNLNNEQRLQVIGAFNLFANKNALSNLTQEDINKFGPLYRGIAHRFKKINGVNGFYYDPTSQKIIHGFKNQTLTSQDIFNQNNPEVLKEREQAEIEKNMNTPISQMNEWSPEMKKEMEAIGWDIASIIDPEAFSGSAMALYASHLRDEANPNRSTLEKWFDKGTAALGGIQGIGDFFLTGKLGYRLYQLGKSMGSVSKFAGMLGAGFGAIGAYEAKDSIAKLTNPSSLTPQDIENISYGFMGLIGLKSFTKARNKQTIGKQANPTVTEHNITIKDKNGTTHEIKIDENTTKDIQELRTFGKKKETVDSEILNMPKIKESIEKYKKANPTKKLEIEGASIVNDSKIGRNKVVTSKQVKNPNVPEYAPVGTKWYNPFGYMAQGNNKWGYYLGGGWQRKAWENTSPEQSSSNGLWQRIKEFWNPEPRPIQSEPPKNIETPKVTETSKSTKTEPLTAEEIKELEKNIEEFNKYIDGGAKHSGNYLSEEPFTVGDFTFDINKIPNSAIGDITISIGNTTKNIHFENQKEMMNKVAGFLKENIKQVIDSNVKKINAKEMGEVLRQLKAKGVFKQGGRIDRQKIQMYKNYIKK